MKVLIDNNHSFAYAHGGIQTFIENLLINLNANGIEAEILNWANPDQTGDIVHFFYRPSEEYLKILRGKVKILINVLLGPTTNYSGSQLVLRKLLYHSLQKYMKGISNSLSLNYGLYADAVIYHSEYEKQLGNILFKCPLDNSFVVLPGVHDEYYQYKKIPNAKREDYLVTLSTIYEVKNSIFLAKIAQRSKIPTVFIGRPFDNNSDYFKEFQKLVDNKYVIYKGMLPTNEIAKLLYNAKAFILLSNYESAPIVLSEASACGCPLILPDLNWATKNYKGFARFISNKNANTAVKQLQDIYRNDLNPSPIFPTKNWSEVTSDIINIYKKIIKQ
jgi:glycosyltransferase involved in cell wall biosynthesis